MKKAICMFFLIVISQVFAVSVDGYAFLEGQTDHSGVKVFLQRTAPDTNYSYTFYTDSTGYYNYIIEGGVYDFSFSKVGFYPYQTEQVCYSDISLSDVTLLDKGFYGEVSGIIHAGVYNVTDTLTVTQGDTLIIEPGVKLQFAQGASFDIYGYLIAEGTETDSIYFTSYPDSDWDGIFIYSTADNNSSFKYSVIENSAKWGLLITYKNPTISNCLFRNNKKTSDYSPGVLRVLYGASPEISECIFENNFQAGIEINGSSATISNVDIHNNIGTWIGGVDIRNSTVSLISSYINFNQAPDYGGIYSFNSDLSIISSNISDNISTSTYNEASAGGIKVTGGSCTINSSMISDNSSNLNGGGIYSDSSELNIINSEIKGNVALKPEYWYAKGGGMYSKSSELYFSYSILSQNSSDEIGGGIFLTGGSALFENSIIADNTSPTGAGAYLTSQCDAQFVNSVVLKNNGHGVWTSQSIEVENCIITDNTDYGIFKSSTDFENTVTFNNVYNNSPANFYNAKDYLGVAVTTNYNGDPCDPWYNISMDPLFLDVWNGDFTLTENSPCIDAGTNTIADYIFPVADIVGNYRLWDGDGNGSEIVDMGAYEYGAPSGIVDNEEQVCNYHLFQNYPNPFNPVTTINYTLPNAGQVELCVYNLQGQLVQSLVDAKQEKGIHQTEFNAGDLTSGLYIYNLKIDGKVVQSRKMMMLK